MLFAESLNEQAQLLLEGPKQQAGVRIPFGKPRAQAAATVPAERAAAVLREGETSRSTPTRRQREEDDGGSQPTSARERAAPKPPHLLMPEEEPAPEAAPATPSESARAENKSARSASARSRSTSRPASAHSLNPEATLKPDEVKPAKAVEQPGRPPVPPISSGNAAFPGAQLATRSRDHDVLDIAQDVESNNMMRLLSTPRAKEACKRLGIKPAELRVKRMQDFAVIGDLPERQKMRFDHYEGKRQQKLKDVLQERGRIMKEQMDKEVAGFSYEGFHSLQMVEDMLDQEARRMEKDVKNQARLQSAVQKHTEQMLGKERVLRERERQRSRARENREALNEQKADQARKENAEKFSRCREILEQSEQEQQQRCAGYQLQRLEEEERLQDFLREKSEKHNEKSELWQQKLEEIERRNAERNSELEVQREKKLDDYQSRIELVEERREEDMRQKLLRAEEQSLKIVDAQEKRQQLQRMNEAKRTEVAQRLEQHSERIDTLFGLKEQILEKRRARNQSRSVEKFAQPRPQGPGPAAYNPRPPCVTEGPAVKISGGQPKNLNTASIDAVISRSRHNPGPGEYNAALLPTGDKVAGGGGGPVFRGDNKKTFLDHEARAARELPGPGSYNSQSTMELRHGTRFGRDYMAGMDLPGAPPKPPTWARISDDCTPGPAAYNVDISGRKRRLRTNASLPVLNRPLDVN